MKRRSFLKLLGVGVAGVPALSMASVKKIEHKAERLGAEYLWVKLDKPTDPDDLDHAAMSINGQSLRVQRGRPVILPVRYVRLLAAAVYLDANGNKCARYPFTIMSDMGAGGYATKAEYDGMMAAGNRMSREAVNWYRNREGWPE